MEKSKNITKQKQDIRSQKTKERIQEAFYSLLKTRSISRIYVTDICDLAGINRATFYKHYLDVPDLVEKIENELISDLCHLFDQVNINHDGHGVIKEMTRLGIEYSFQNKHLISICSEKGDRDFPMKLFLAFRDKALPMLHKAFPTLDETTIGLLYMFLTMGTSGAIINWYSNNQNMDLDVLTDHLSKICIATANAYTKQC